MYNNKYNDFLQSEKLAYKWKKCITTRSFSNPQTYRIKSISLWKKHRPDKMIRRNGKERHTKMYPEINAFRLASSQPFYCSKLFECGFYIRNRRNTHFSCVFESGDYSLPQLQILRFSLQSQSIHYSYQKKWMLNDTSFTCIIWQ